jgi:dynein heavy chain 1, cytosolic
VAARRGATVQLVDIERNPIQNRLMQIIRIRKEHQQLKSIILKTISQSQGSGVVLGNSGTNTSGIAGKNFEEKALDEINEAYNCFFNINVLDISKEGQDLWELTKRIYDNKIDRVESKITLALKDKLASTANANQMFKVFSFFQPLFTRPRIRGAIREYQKQILQ